MSRDGIRAPCHTFDVLFTTISVSGRPNAMEPLAEAEILVSTTETDNQCSGGENVSWASADTEKSKPHSFVRNVIMKNIAHNGSHTSAMKLFLPAVEGYIVRNDIIQRRFLNFDLAQSLSDFTKPGQHVESFITSGKDIFQRAVNYALGAISLRDLPGVNKSLLESFMSLLESEVTDRLSFPWVTENATARRRLAIVEGRPHPSMSAASEGVLRAAAALDIDLVILDQQGHWLEDVTNEHLRDEFLACELQIDDELPNRIVAALSKSKGTIDGITTYSDKHLIATAKAAQILGLWTNPPEAIEACSDKRKMREAITPDLPKFTVTGITDLEEQLGSLLSPVQYPLIVKPTQGNSSEGVSRVFSDVALRAAVRKIEEQLPGKTFLIEPYVSGPEVDANFVLLDGKIVFDETNDDFPSSAEISHASPSPSFAETLTIMPSILPESELALLKSSLSKILTSMGCQDGVFHVEARVKDSRKSYTITNKGLELAYRQTDGVHHPDPSIFLIEINARTPGHQESFAAEYTYGIDYYAFYMLLAVLPPSSARRSNSSHLGKDRGANSDLARLHALSHPFPAHIQYPTGIVFIPVDRGGTFVCAKSLPQPLMEFIPHFRILIKEGQVVQDPELGGKWPFVAYFLVTAKLVGRDGREQVRTLSESVRAKFEYELS